MDAVWPKGMAYRRGLHSGSERHAGAITSDAQPRATFERDRSSVPIVVQRSRLDSRQPTHALLSTGLERKRSVAAATLLLALRTWQTLLVSA